jgi:hypothetical protein
MMKKSLEKLLPPIFKVILVASTSLHMTHAMDTNKCACSSLHDQLPKNLSVSILSPKRKIPDNRTVYFNPNVINLMDLSNCQEEYLKYLKYSKIPRGFRKPQGGVFQDFIKPEVYAMRKVSMNHANPSDLMPVYVYGETDERFDPWREIDEAQQIDTASVPQNSDSLIAQYLTL